VAVSAPSPPPGALRDLRLLGDVARICNRAADLDQVLGAALARICTAGGWPLGRLRPLGHLRPLDDQPGAPAAWSEVWSGTPPAALERFDALASPAFRAALGSDPAHALVAGRPVWISDLGGAAGSAAAALLMVPVPVADRLVAVLELFAAEGFEPDAERIEVATQIGIELGRAVERAEHQHLISELAERERQRIGAELHDGVGQQLAALGWLARTLERRLAAGAGVEPDSISALVLGIEEAQAALRSLARGLVPAPVDSSSLPDALESLVGRCGSAAGVSCTFECEPGVRVDDAAAPHLFRIAQEALRNAVEHAKANQIAVRLGAFGLEVRDDGVGMESRPEREGAGLRIMRQRAALIGAALSVESSRGAGTCIRCSLRPSCPPADAHSSRRV
jgi:signal transduction histidine kinase